MPTGSASADPGRLLGPPVVSPDGRAIVVSLTIGAGSQLFVRRLDSDKLVALEGTAGAVYPFWSPDSKVVGFFADDQLKRVTATGGKPKAVCAAPFPRGGAWSRLGVLIFAINGQAIYRCPESGGERVPITTLDENLGENSHRYPVFLPDGHHFLYFARTNDISKRAVYLQSLDGGPRKRILIADGQFAVGRDSTAGLYYLLSQQAGRIFAQRLDPETGVTEGEQFTLLEQGGQVSVSDTGVLVVRPERQDRSELVWFDRAGRRLSTIGNPTDYWQVSLSPDGHALAVIKHDYLSVAFELWSAQLPGGQLEPFSTSSRILSPAWSADSKTRYYTSNGQQVLRREFNPR